MRSFAGHPDAVKQMHVSIRDEQVLIQREDALDDSFKGLLKIKNARQCMTVDEY
jgi:hypothetical protein